MPKAPSCPKLILFQNFYKKKNLQAYKIVIGYTEISISIVLQNDYIITNLFSKPTNPIT